VRGELTLFPEAVAGGGHRRGEVAWLIQTVLRPARVKGFVVLPKRWIVERTSAWLGRYGRHSKDYERNPATSEAMIYIAMIHIMLRRLEKARS
jgi:putative transposase